jgi:hypothetical protein
MVFYTIRSAADMKWPDMISTIAKQYGVHYSDEEIEALSFELKSKEIQSQLPDISVTG